MKRHHNSCLWQYQSRLFFSFDCKPPKFKKCSPLKPHFQNVEAQGSPYKHCLRSRCSPLKGGTSLQGPSSSHDARLGATYRLRPTWRLGNNIIQAPDNIRVTSSFILNPHLLNWQSAASSRAESQQSWRALPPVKGVHLWKEALVFKCPPIHMMAVSRLHIHLYQLRDEATP